MKFLIVVGALCGAAMAQTSISGAAQEPVSGVQAPYTQTSDQSQQEMSKARASTAPAQHAAAAENSHVQPRTSNKARQGPRSPAQGGSQLCFVPGQGYVPRSAEGCPAAPSTTDEATANETTANKAGAAKPAFDLNAAKQTDSTPMMQQAVSASTSPEDRKAAQPEEAVKKERKSVMASRFSPRKSLCDDDRTQPRSSVLRSQKSDRHKQLCGIGMKKDRHKPESQPSNAPFHRN